MLNLAVQDACKESHIIKALDLFRAVVNYVKDSPKRETSFSNFLKLEECVGSFELRPLCSTRWVCREPALKSFVQNYRALLQWFAELTITGSPSDKKVALGHLISLTKFKNYFTIRLLLKMFSIVHWTHLAIQNPNLSITNCTKKINNMLCILKAESTAKAGSSLYYLCVHECIPVEEGGIGISQPQTPRGLKSSYHAENSKEIQSQFEENRPLSVKIEEYFVGLYIETFKDIIESVEARYNISPIILEMEKYLATTNDKEFSERKEDISKAATHVGANPPLLELEMKRFRRY